MKLPVLKFPFSSDELAFVLATIVKFIIYLTR